MSNAFKFTDEGEISVDISMSKNNPDHILIEVKDSGIGIAENIQTKLFESYIQADQSITRRFGGTGLGLTICKRIIALMGGTISLNSIEGQGTTFIVDLPITVDKHDSTSANEPDNIVRGDGQLHALSVLVAEDNDINRMVINGMLMKLVSHIVLVNDGEQALDKIKSGRKFDLILMDCEMPVMDGITACSAIHAYQRSENTPLVPIYALTAHVSDENQQCCLKSGMSGVLTKPVSISALKKLLHVLSNPKK